MSLRRVIIAGTRGFGSYRYSDPPERVEAAEKELAWAFDRLDAAFPERSLPIEVVSGAARSGGDRIGELWGKSRGCLVTLKAADWNKYGKSASFIRNEEMAQYAACGPEGSGLIAFWDARSSGTRDMLARAVAHDLKIRLKLIRNTALPAVDILDGQAGLERLVKALRELREST